MGHHDMPELVKMAAEREVPARARAFLYENARLVDRRRYEFWFEGGPKEAVIAALRAYQNPDGGFGNALEADIRCPHSQPAATELALVMMDEIDLFDPEVLDGIIRFLRGITLPEGGLPFVFRNASDDACAPWWKTDRDDVPSINPTGRILALLYRQRVRTDIFAEEWFRKNEDYVWSVIERGQPTGYHDAVNWLAFLQHVPDRERALPHLAGLDVWLAGTEAIVRDPKAEGYVQKVLDWAPRPDSYAARFVTEAEVREHLEALLREQREDGGWPINWQTVSPGAELEWRGWLTVERLKTLRAYGVI
ncbi:prenyltransferase/squalene oxidase repeat-containing protein [Thermobacillus sp. ZCTH02-B1]|uniref:prenyltransferase/squalene oxidase repeat-containing protein n=1 Tax=Thermobacillus sp. ZCTH02-B1 TaxID=1858795 RepID=UPI0025F0DFC5|nr:prenyltransferase/squalene oxidase repeat-containing protein [Thermobacillus sp. ZCTH02-B1]